MGNSDIGSREGGQGFLHRFLGRNIQMVGRLVQHQEIRPRQHQLQKGQPGLLTAGQGANQPEYIIPMEKERPQIAAALLLGQAVLVLHFLQQGALHMQPLMLLGKVADFYPGANLYPPLRSFQLTYQKPQKGSLSGTVWPHDGHAVSLADQHIHMLKELFLRVREMICHILQLCHPLGALPRLVKGKIVKGRCLRRPDNPLQPVQLALAPPCLL